MLRALILLLATVPTASPGGGDSPPQWSRDGHWLAFTEAATRPQVELPQGWVLDPRRLPTTPPSPVRSETIYRVVVTEVATGRSLTLAEGREPFSAPSWRPDGASLAFGRLARPADGRPVLELVVQEGLHSQRVLGPLPLDPATNAGEELPQLAPTWSPDSRFLAVAGLQGGGLAVLRSDNGRVLRTVENARRPAWSVDGLHLAFLRSSGLSAGLYVLDAGFGPERRVATLGQVYQSPAWSRDGRSVLVVTTRPELRRFGTSTAIEMVRIDLESGAKETVAPIAIDSGRKGRPPVAVSFALDRECDDLFYTCHVEGQASTIVWFRPRTEETVDRFPPLDMTVRMGALAQTLSGRVLAFRLGSPGAGAPVGVWDVARRRLIPIVPDDDARAAWLTLLVHTAHALLKSGLPEAKVDQRTVERPTLLPVPGELPRSHELTRRIHRLGEIGRPLCERVEGNVADPTSASLFRESRLFFDYLHDDYLAAMKSLEGVEGRVENPDDRVRLLVLRSQILLGLGERDQALDVVGYLREIESKRPRQIEATPAGYVVSEIPTSGRGWADYLGRRAAPPKPARDSDESSDEEPPRFRPNVPMPPAPHTVPFNLR